MDKAVHKKTNIPNADFSKLDGGSGFENPEAETGGIVLIGPRAQTKYHCSKGAFVGAFRYFREKLLSVSWEKFRNTAKRE